MTQAIKVSKAGIDVGTATNPNDFIFDSTLNTLKIISSGLAIGTVSSSSTGTVSVAHGESYTPLMTAFVKKQGGSIAITTSQFIQGGDSFKVFSTSTDGTNFHFEIRNDGGAAGTYDIRYFIFEPPL